MNFNSSTIEMKANVELYLREMFKANWSENRKQVDSKNNKDDVLFEPTIVPEMFKKCKKASKLTCTAPNAITIFVMLI